MKLKIKHNFQSIGFTLIELMIAVGVLAILTSTGAAIFSRTLRGSSDVELRRALDDRARVITRGLSRFFMEGKMVSLALPPGAAQDRSSCLAAGQITGNVAVIQAPDGLDTTLNVDTGIISSTSGVISVSLNPESVTVNHKSGLGYYFTWYCSKGSPDRLTMTFNAASIGQQGEVGLGEDYVVDVIMRNSGQ